MAWGLQNINSEVKMPMKTRLVMQVRWFVGSDQYYGGIDVPEPYQAGDPPCDRLADRYGVGHLQAQYGQQPRNP